MGCCGGKEEFKPSMSDFDAIDPDRKPHKKKVYRMRSIPGWNSSDDSQNEIKRGLSEDVMNAPGGKPGKKKKKKKPQKVPKSTEGKKNKLSRVLSHDSKGAAMRAMAAKSKGPDDMAAAASIGSIRDAQRGTQSHLSRKADRAADRVNEYNSSKMDIRANQGSLSANAQRRADRKQGVGPRRKAVKRDVWTG
eukprot:COSAG05_NODE_253_length_12854_cov_23.790200_1_plen_192_part_00